MAPLGTGRYAAILGRLLTVGGVLEVAPELAPEISPIIGLESDRPEWLFLSNQRYSSITLQPGASIGNPSYARLRNPTASNVLAVIESIKLDTTLAAGAGYIIRIGSAATDRTNVGTAVGRDTRYVTTTGMAALIGSPSNAAGRGTALETGRMLLSTTINFSQPIILSPGFHVDAGSDDTNLLVDVTFHWRERELGKYERR